MKGLKFLLLGCFFILFNQPVFAGKGGKCPFQECQNLASLCQKSHFGTSGFSVTDPNLWYTIETNSYPEVTPLSIGRNKGDTEGGVFLSPTGFTISEAGNYWVSISAVLQNPTEDSTVLIPVFLSINEVYDPDAPTIIGGVVTLETNSIQTLQGTGTLKNIAAGSRLALVATNAGYPFPVPVTVVAWSISLFKLP